MSSDLLDKIREKVKCCACGGSLQSNKFVNGIALNKLATWKQPIWGNILVRDKYPEPRAIAIICDDCIERKKQPKYAVEWNDGCSEVKYHKMEKLKDLPDITKEDVYEAEAKLNVMK